MTSSFSDIDLRMRRTFEGAMAGQGLTLDELKARMTEEQRRDMAEIVANEVKRRESMKQAQGGARPAQKSGVRSSRISRGLGAEGLGEVYGEIQDRVKELRMKELDDKLAQAKTISRQVPRPARSGKGRIALFSPRNLLILGIVTLGILKIALGAKGPSTGSAKTEAPAVAAIEQPVSETPAAASPVAQAKLESAAPALAPIADGADRRLVGWSVAEKQVLTELDARRVELERRRQELDQREEDIKNQAQALAERLAELKSLSTRVSQVRKERDNQYEARLEQLANVYGSMAPNEAAPLVGKLDEETALALLKRMPGKRMGQVLSAMDPERAVELTKVLSDKNKLEEDVPAR